MGCVLLEFTIIVFFLSAVRVDPVSYVQEETHYIRIYRQIRFNAARKIVLIAWREIYMREVTMSMIFCNKYILVIPGFDRHISSLFI